MSAPAAEPPLGVVLAVGDATLPEFGDAVAVLRTTPGALFVAIDEADRLLSGGQCLPQVVVLLQSRPGELDTALVARWMAVAPLAEFVAVLGSWCEGEVRSGRPWPGVRRLYAVQAAGWLKQLDRRTRPAGGQTPLPPTANEEDRLLALPPPARRTGAVLLRASRADEAWLRPALEAAGYEVAPLWPDSAARPPAAAVFACDEVDQPASEAIAAAAASWPDTLIVVLTNFPRPLDVQAARAAGAACVLTKPLLLDDLWRALVRP